MVMKRTLFEFKLTQRYYESRNIREFLYQIPARDERHAIMRLGQTYNRQDVYEIQILDIKEIASV
jgi:hypothetical protein